MPTTITGVASPSDPTATPSATCPADADTGNAASVNGAFQMIMNALGWFRQKCALLNMGGGVITNHGTPTNTGDVATKGYVDARSKVWSTVISLTGATLTGPTAVSLWTGTPPAGALPSDVCVVTQLGDGGNTVEVVLTAHLSLGAGVLAVTAVLPFSGNVTYASQNIIVVGFR